MLSKVYSHGLSGLSAYPITIEVDVSNGLPSTIIVGLPDNAIKESRERVRSAIKNSGFNYPAQRITINLSPADIKKEGSSFDLPIALGILGATEQIDASCLQQYLFLGQLSLDGGIQSIDGALSIALSLPKDQFNGIILPHDNAREAAVVNDIHAYPVKSLIQVAQFLQNSETIDPLDIDTHSIFSKSNKYDIDFDDVKGQSSVKRGLEIAASGGHNCLLIGPPGSGKTMLAKRLTTILPDMTLDESLETTQIHSVVGLRPPNSTLMGTRPFRSPHHTSSDVALVGGGSTPKPGEVTLSHNGLLFLDELPEFNRNVLEALRQPLEDREVTIARASKTLRFPAQFMLVCAMNPCPCGWYTDPKKECHCNPLQIQRYISKISGPLLDRIDLHLDVPSLKSGELLSPACVETSQDIKLRATKAREKQYKRFQKAPIFTNAQMSHRHIKTYCLIDEKSKDLLKRAIDELGLSARAHDKILKIARTIADLDQKDEIFPYHISEAIQYRSLDRAWWG